MIFLGIGSSIGDAQEVFEKAERLLEKKGIDVVQKSTVFKNPPMTDDAKNDFNNAVWEIVLRKQYSPLDFLLALKGVEREVGRDMRAPRWSDRVLDLDILIFDKKIIKTPNLTIPHPGIAERDFVLIPLAELVDESFEIPTLGTLASLLKHENPGRCY